LFSHLFGECWVGDWVVGDAVVVEFIWIVLDDVEGDFSVFGGEAETSCFGGSAYSGGTVA